MDQRELVGRARQGDHDAFAELVDPALARLDAAARLILRDQELARDAVQEALIRAWRDLPGLRDPGRFDAWLRRLTVNACLDIERTVGLSEGNIFAGEFLAPQMYFFRPAPGWSQYRTPIDGYYQCGSGTHPGGCVMGAPGKLAAGQILKDRARAAARA